MSWESERKPVNVQDDLDDPLNVTPQRPSAVSLLLGPPLFVTAIIVGTILLVVGHDQYVRHTSFARDCVSIESDARRLACYDEAQNRPQRYPARGGGATGFGQ